MATNNDREPSPELEETAGKLADCWLLLDELARKPDKDLNAATMHAFQQRARQILIKQDAPGWK